MQDACIDKRNNGLGVNTVKQISCKQAESESSETCETVFTPGRPGNMLMLRQMGTQVAHTFEGN